MDRSGLEEFFLNWLEARDVPVEAVEPGVYRALLAGESAPRELTFEPEAAQESAARELITFGSPLLEQAFQETLAAGRVLHLYAAAKEPDAAVMDQRIRAHLTFDRVRCLGLAPGRLVEGRLYRFDFVLTIHGDVVQQLSFAVTVDASTGLPAAELPEGQLRRRLEERRLAVLPIDSEAPPARIVEAAVQELSRASADRLETLTEELAAQGLKEQRRVTAYFAQMEEELESRAGRARTPEAKRKAEEARAATRAERLLRLRELAIRYSPQVEARLSAVEVLHVPRYKTDLLIQRGPRTVGLPMRYDLLTGTASLPACPSCAQPAELLVGRREGDSIGCGTCVPRPKEEEAPALEATPPPAPSTPPRREPTPPVASAPARSPARRQVTSRFGKEAPLRIAVHFLPLVLRAESQSWKRALKKPQTLPPRALREILQAPHSVLSVPPLIVAPDADRDGRLRGSGVSLFLLDTLLAPDAFSQSMQKQVTREINNRCNDAVRKKPIDMVLCTPSQIQDPPGLMARTGEVEYRGALLGLVAVGVDAAVTAFEESGPDLATSLGSILTRELGVHGKGDALWPLAGCDEADDFQQRWPWLRSTLTTLLGWGDAWNASNAAAVLRQAFLQGPARFVPGARRTWR